MPLNTMQPLKYKTTGGLTDKGELTSADPKTVQKQSLGTAADIIKGSLGKEAQYAPDVSGLMKGPAQSDYYSRTSYSPLQTYEGIGQGGYENLQQSLNAPILNQAQQAQQNIESIYGGRGLYGSSGTGLMSGAMGQSQQATQNALSDAMVKRYGLQMQDIEGLRRQAENDWRAGAMETTAANEYAQQQQAYDLAQRQKQIDFENQQRQAQADYMNRQQAWQDARDQMQIDRLSQLAGLGTSGAGLQAQQNIANANRRAASDAALWGGLGQLAGGLLGSPTAGGGSVGGDLAGGAWDALSNLWS